MTLPQRIADRIDASGDCWLWTGRIRPDGYGDAWHEGRTRVVHRLVYELLVRTLLADEKLDHLCRNRACVNPDHLDVVDGRTNILRGFGAPAMAARRTACRFGHPLTPSPTRPRRVCKTCSNAQTQAYRDRVKTAAGDRPGRLSKEKAAA